MTGSLPAAARAPAPATPGTEERPLRILLLEDVPRDADLVLRELRRAGLVVEARVIQSGEELLSNLGTTPPDVILSRYLLPSFTGLEALALRNEHAPAVPFVIVTDPINEETAVDCLRRGADDYVTKAHLLRLPSAVLDALRKKQLEREERAAGEEARRAAHEWSTTFDALRDGIMLLDGRHRILRCNLAASKMLGHPAQQLVGRECCALLHGSAERIPNCPGQRTLATGRRASEQITLGQRHYEVSTEPISDEAGRVNRFVHVLTDVTEHRQAQAALLASERRYHDLFEGTGNGIVIADAQTRAIQYANAAICRMVGCTEQELQQQRIEDLFPEEHREKHLKAFAAHSRGVAVPALNIPLRHEGRETLRVDIQPLRMTLEGRPMMMGLFTDVTERSRLVLEKEQLAAQLRQAQKLEAVGRLAGGVAHDFNNLLTVIINYTGFALDELLPEDPLREDLDEVRKAGERAVALTRQLLAFSRKQVLAPQVLDLNRLVSNLERMLCRMLGEDIDIDLRLAEELGRVRADPGQLEQVLMNLSVNARDAMPEGGTLTIETADVHIGPEQRRRHGEIEPGSYVRLTVSDTGCGMDAQVMEHLFEPFFTTKEKGKGTGLGLSTVYGIVKQSGGYISAESEPGQGSRFQVLLPRVDALAEDPSRKAMLQSESGRELVLVVEDQEAVRHLVQRILSQAGYRVLTTANGGEALLAFEKHGAEIDLLLTDVVMPQLNGKALSERLVRLKPTLRTLYMSGYTDDVISVHGVLEPGVQLISKPLRAEELTRKVREVLDSERLEV